MWIRKLLVGLFGENLETTVIHSNNKSCFNLSKDPMFHDKSKHIEIKYHCIKYMVEGGVVRL